MNYYKEAIEICSKEQDWRSIVFEIAKANPSAIVKAVKSLNSPPGVDVRETARILASLEGEVISLLNNNQYVAAIKYCREHTGLGLKDAKDFVDKFRS